MERFVDERRDDDDEPREMIAIGYGNCCIEK